jgi:hypothetical protein
MVTAVVAVAVAVAVVTECTSSCYCPTKRHGAGGDDNLLTTLLAFGGLALGAIALLLTLLLNTAIGRRRRRRRKRSLTTALISSASGYLDEIENADYGISLRRSAVLLFTLLVLNNCCKTESQCHEIYTRQPYCSKQIMTRNVGTYSISMFPERHICHPHISEQN